jgi:hypothetical protein
VSSWLHNKRLVPAVAEQVLDVGPVLRDVDHVAHGARPPLAAAAVVI